MEIKNGGTKMNHKIIRAIDFVILAGTFLTLMFAMRYAQPLVISPIDNLVTTNNSFLFSFEKGDVIFIDDNSDFTSPEKIFVQDNIVINLKPGTYYWKVQGAADSDVRKLTILSVVDLKIRKTAMENTYELVNGGNTRLNVDVYTNDVLNHTISISPDENKNMSGTKFIGGENA